MKYPAYPKYKSSGVEWLGAVPAHWEVKRLKSIGCFKAGAGFPDNEQGNEDEELPFLKVSDMNNDGNNIYMNNATNTVSRLTAKKLGAQIFRKNTVIFAKVGAALLLNRRRIIARDTCIDNNTMGYIINKADHKYIYYWLLPIDFGRLSNPGAVPSINDGQLREISIALPPIPEQQTIADFLDCETGRIDALIGKKQKLIDLLKEKRTALISHAVTKGLNPKVKMKPSGVEWLGDVPEHWKVERLKYQVSINDEAYPETMDPDFELVYVDISSVDSMRGIIKKEPMTFENAPSRARRIVRDGDTIISTVRTYLRAIAPVVKPEDNLTVSTGFAVVRPRIIDKNYLSKMLTSPYFIEDVVSRSVGVSYPAINASDIGLIHVTLPPTTEQQAIAEYLDRETGKIDALVAKAETAIEKLKEYRTALISAAVTGRIDVREVA